MNASALPSSEPFKQRWPEKKKKKKEWGEGREQKHMHTQKQQPKKNPPNHPYHRCPAVN